MKFALYLLAVVAISNIVIGYKQADNQPQNADAAATPHQSAPSERLKKDASVSRSKAKRVTPAKHSAQTTKKHKPPDAKPAKAVSCRQAIDLVFPPHLRDGAAIVLEHENGAGDPVAIGETNWDGSRDFGCFQINNFAHPDFFATSDWRDPVANATQAMAIYNGRQAQTGNGWQAWYATEGILW